ncbi:protein kinase domain-containing protein [Dokdonella sp.]|uniref:protein kinase domain-containing protein n=1 Tax=Dokdonella sp. TaxID=2291710 RepID=UPI002F3EBCB6
MSAPGRAPDLVDRFVDGEPIDWSGASAQDDALLDALHTLDQVRAAYQRIGAPDPRGPRLFAWGPLAVQEKIGSGASAEVFRAWDAGLATPVALKLLRPEAAAAGLRSEEFLREGRLLARISQRNVLRVYGAAVHDGRPGIWAEWIEGRTLDAIVESDGVLADREAAHVGLELCAALAAIHAAGLVHGDVKASNVLRARGGRIVLADLGAAGTPDALNASLRTQVTPAYLSPQSRDGAPRAAADDIYALGVLLHFLLTGAYPRDGVAHAALADSDTGVAAVVVHALARDPRVRPATPQAFAAALRAALDERATVERRPRWRVGAIAGLAVALVVVAFAAAHWLLPAWAPQVELLRRIADGRSETLQDGAILHAGDRLDLRLASRSPTWVYVLNEDAHGDFHVLFPLAGLDRANPVPPGDVLLPGTQGARSLSWEVSSTGGRDEFLVLLSRAPLVRLEQRLVALPDAAVERGVARTVANPPAVVQVRGARLNALLQAFETELADARRVRMRAWHFGEPDRP